MTWRRRALLDLLTAVPGLVLLLDGASLAWGYAKDDSWISFRYARNLVDGQGLVFNPGEPIEGYTNFLWTVLMAPVVGLGVDPMPFAAALGTFFTALALLGVVRGARELGAPAAGAALAGILFAIWPSVPLWAVGGLEQGLIEALVSWGCVAALVAARGGGRASEVAAGLLLAGAALTRPEGHAIAGVALLAARRPLSAGVALAVLVPYHAWRLAFFGSLVPNTYLVKGGSGFRYWEWGLDFAGDALWFGDLWAVLALGVAALALSERAHRAAIATAAALVALFFVYLVKVGADELIWFRLLLPVYPLAAALAGVGAHRIAARGRGAAVGVAALAALLIGHVLWDSRADLAGMSGYNDDSRRFHADIGKYLTRHSAPGESVAFQDMGSTPFHAPDLVFVDTIGLVDRFMADLHHRYEVNPFLKDYWRRRPDGKAHLSRMYAEGRAYLAERDPDWVVYVAFPPEAVRSELKAALRAAPDTNPVDRYLKDLTFYHGWAGDPGFRERYRYVRTWRRSSKYWITLWRRKDHALPADVVQARAPEGLGPPIQTLGGRFLGGTVEPEAVTAGELWVEAWLAPDGPASPSVLVDLTFRREGSSKTAFVETHVPGDWLWPGDRWAAGQVVRDRVLVQLPASLRPGAYEVTWRLRERATGVGGEPVPLGRVEVRERPWWDGTRIAPTDPAEQRSAPVSLPRPERIEGPVLAVGGDVNLGRRQNALTAADGPQAALGQVAGLRAADLAYANLESVLAPIGDYRVDKGERGPYYYRGRPELAAVLDAAGVDVVGTANNHAGDYGPAAVLAQAALLDGMGIGRPGSGADRAEACAPVYRRAGELVVAFVTVDATEPNYAAKADRPGSCFLRLDDAGAWSGLAGTVREARERAHLVLLGVHWGVNGKTAPSDAMRRAARAAIGAGFDAILGSSAHLLHGVETIDGRPVLYDTGNLLFDARDDTGSALFELVLAPSGVRQVRVAPLRAGFGATAPATGEDGAMTLAELAARTRALGTPAWVDAEALWITLPEPPPRPPPVAVAPPDPPRAPAPPPSDDPPPGCTAEQVPADAARPPVAVGPLTLLGWRVGPERIVGRAMVDVETWWRVDAPLTENLLLDTRVVPRARGTTWSGDHDGCDWAFPTSRWRPGVVYHDRFAVRPPQRLQPGTYEVLVGVTPAPLGAIAHARPLGTVEVAADGP